MTADGLDEPAAGQGARRAVVRLRVGVALGLVLGAHGLVNTVWLLRDRSPLTWDPAHHLRYGLLYADLLADLRPTRAWLSSFLHMNVWIHPPLYHWVMALFLLVFGRSVFWAYMANLVWLTLLVVGTYSAGKRLWGHREGLLAAILVSLYPMVIDFSRLLFTDFAALALTAISLWFLLRTGGFHERAASVSFGLSVGFGLLTKPTYPTFLVVPMVLVLARTAREAGGVRSLLRDRGWLGNVVLGSVAAVAVALVWYGVMRMGFVHLLLAHLRLNTEGLPFWCARSLLYYPSAFIDSQVSLALAAALGVAVTVLVRTGMARDRGVRLTAFGIVGPMLLQTLTVNKHLQQDIGILPFVALLTAAGFLAIPRPNLRRTAVGTLLGVGVIQAAWLTFGAPTALQAITWSVGPLRMRLMPVARPPSPTEWPLDHVTRRMAEGFSVEAPAVMITVSDTPQVNGQTLRLSALLQRLPLVVEKAFDLGLDGFQDRLRTADFVVLQTGWQPLAVQAGNPLLPPDIQVRVLEHFRASSGDFRERWALALPDGSQLLVYERAVSQ